MRPIQCILLALVFCGCASIPRSAQRAVIARLEFRGTPPLSAIEQLSAAIAECDMGFTGIVIDRTPTRVVRPKKLVDLMSQMDELESTYLASLPTQFGEPFVTFLAEEISVHDACDIVSGLLNMNLVYRPDSVVFRFGPETAVFRTYSVPEGMIEALKDYPDDGWDGLRCFEPPPPWDDDCMIGLHGGTTILLVGSEGDHDEFREELKKRHNQSLHRTTDSRASASPCGR